MSMVSKQSRHRSEVEICVCILSAVMERPMRKTWIMNEANLNHALVTKNLRHLVDSGFLSCDSGGAFYELTDLGRDFLDQYERLRLVANRMHTTMD